MGIGVELNCLEGIRVVDFTQFEAGPHARKPSHGSGPKW